MTNSSRLTHFVFSPDAAITRQIGRIDALRDNAFELELAHLLVKLRPETDLVIAVADTATGSGQQSLQTLLSLDERCRHELRAIEIMQIRDESRGV